MKSSANLGFTSKCSGCTACLNICSKQAIEMFKNDKGFLYPKIDSSKCVDCGLCTKNCPWLISEDKTNPYLDFFAAKRIDFKKRLQSQSGGAFSVFAEFFLKNKGVVYGVSSEGRQASYARVDKMRQLAKLKGSKYVQANIRSVFSRVANDLKNNKKVLFSGTACHVDGLKKYLSFKKVDSSLLVTIDIICHGVVSPLFFEQYIEYIERLHGKKVKNFNFRDKTFGWHGHITTYKMGTNVYKSKDYVKIFYSSYVLRDSCYECQYANLKRISDITVGDCWGIGDFYPNFDDNKGCSLIILNSENGKVLFNETKNEFELLHIDKEKALQPNLSQPTKKPSNYDDFWLDYKKFGFEYVIYKYCEVNPLNDSVVLKKHQVLKRVKAKIQRMLGLR